MQRNKNKILYNNLTNYFESNTAENQIKHCLIDTHCHINIMVKEQFDVAIDKKGLDLANKIALEAEKNGVKTILNVGTSIIECKNCISIAQCNKNMYCAVGIHPCDVTDNYKKDLQEIKNFLKESEKNKIVSIGECGLDLYHRQDTLSQQIDLFKAQIELSLEKNLPLNIHMRQATDQMYKLLEEFKGSGLRGVMHCFPENINFANFAINLGLLIGVGGPITYPKNTVLQDVIAQISIEKIILETDAPFLPPQIIRGQQNHPKYILNIAEQVAKIKNLSLDEVATKTTENAINLFKFY